MDAPVTAPPVVAVMVTADPGPWFEESLGALARQDYPNLSVLVLDAGQDDVTPRVAAVLPGAYVRRVPGRVGFGATVNEVLSVVEGASHLLVCHDDVAPDDDAVRVLVEEAFRSNAGIVSPKLVDWHDPDRLLQVGMSVDKLATPVPIVERGERDQEQHDAVRDVFVAPSACMLVRADLFAGLGGFDPAIAGPGDDVDLSWRAQVAGARVVVAPAGRVRHIAAGERRPGRRSGGGVDELQVRHSLRTVLKCYGALHLVRVVPQALVVSVAQALLALLTGRRRSAGAVWRAWRWNLSTRAERREARRSVQQLRALPDREVRRLQSRGLAGVRAFAQEHHLVGDDQARVLEAATRSLRGGFRFTLGWALAAGLGLVLLAGSRDLVFGRLAALGELAPMPGSPLDLLRLWASGSRPVGAGGVGPPPPAHLVLGVLGTAAVGAADVAFKVLVLGLVPLGLVGAHRLASSLGPVAAATATAAYAASPLPYNALATGRWSGLAAYAALPWALRPLLAGDWALDPGGAPARGWRPVAVAGAVAAAGGAVSLAVPLALVVGGLGLAGGLALLARPAAGLAARVSAAGALGLALLLPWSASLAERVPAIGPHGAGRLLRLETGPLGAGPLGYALLVAAGLALLVGQGPRLAAAAGGWTMAVSAIAATWAAGRGWTWVGGGAPEATLAPAALGVALAVGAGVRAFQVDLREHHFGWRQAVSVVAAAGLVLGALPVLGAAFDGRWHQPTRDFAGLLSWMGERDAGRFRVVWLGAPRTLPLGGWRLAPRLAHAGTVGGPPDLSATWAGLAPAANRAVTGVLREALAGSTTDAGEALARSGVRFVVVTRRPSPAGIGTATRRAQPAIERALAQQVDLGRIESDDAVVVYENAAWTPADAVARPAFALRPVWAAAAAGQVLVWSGLGLLLARRRR